jgi:formylmethanofuran:tetrahydromethanopterin formyltransferase
VGTCMHGRLEIERCLGAPASTGAVLGTPAHALGQRLERLAEGSNVPVGRAGAVVSTCMHPSKCL